MPASPTPPSSTMASSATPPEAPVARPAPSTGRGPSRAISPVLICPAMTMPMELAANTALNCAGESE